MEVLHFGVLWEVKKGVFFYGVFLGLCLFPMVFYSMFSLGFLGGIGSGKTGSR